MEINSVSNLRSYSNAHELTSVDGTTQTFDDDGNLTLTRPRSLLTEPLLDGQQCEGSDFSITFNESQHFVFARLPRKKTVNKSSVDRCR